MTRKLLLIPVVLAVCFGCARRNPRILPHALVGHWTTNAASYHGRFLELSQAFIIIGAGEEGSPTVQTIERVESRPEDHETVFTVYSTMPDGEHDQITLRFSPRNSGEIRIDNQGGVVWKRMPELNPSGSVAGSTRRAHSAQRN